MSSTPSQPTPETAQAFVSALGTSQSPVRSAVVNWPSRLEEAQTGLAAARRLRDYQGYLAQARGYKASGIGRPGDIDKQVLVAARNALSDLHVLATSTLDLVGGFSPGALDQMAEAGRRSVQAAGTVSTRDLWKHVTAKPEQRDALAAGGIDSGLVAALDETMSTGDLHVSAGSQGLRLASAIDGSAVDASLATSPRPRRATIAADLLTRGRFGALSDALRRGEPAYLDGIPFSDEDLHTEDVVLYATLATYGEGVRHVRKLEDTGLETYRGADPATALIVIADVALGLLLAGGIVMAVFCDRFSSDAQDISEGSVGCVIGKVMFWLGMIGMMYWLANGKSAKPGQSNLSMGSVVTHGALRDFQLVRQ